jgi:hypothetical protein
MRPWQLGAALTLGVAALGGSGAVGPAAAPAASVAWMDDYEAARTEARRSGKPLFVAFR